jgi:molecular chaperone DnaJ
MSNQDYYQLLGVSRDADSAELKKAYKRLVMKYHPDRNPDKDGAHKLKEINQAYDVLSDQEKRKIYDHYGAEGVAAAGARQGGGRGGFEGFGDGFGGGFSSGGGAEDFFGNIFGDFFGGKRGGAGADGRQGSNVQVRLDLDFQDAVLGRDMEIPISTPTSCDTCSGSGMRKGATPNSCPDCGGAGKVHVSQGIFSIRQECMRCSGSGTIIDDPCPKCDGAGTQRKKRTINISVPAGVDNDNVLTVRGQGAPSGPGGRVGDLLLVIRVREHELFERDGADLYCQMPVSISELALGAQINVPTLEGEVSVKLPAGTQSGKRLRLNGKGVPQLRGGARGDLYCQVMAETPVRVSGELKELLKKMEAQSGERNNPERAKWSAHADRFVRSVAEAQKTRKK